MNAEFLDMPLAEQVKAEALANAYRRETARQVGTTSAGRLRGPGAPMFNGFGERIRTIAAELEADEAAERRRGMKTPSDLIKTAKAEWPDQSAAVKAYADEAGLPLGEAWKQLIDDATKRLRGR